MHMADALISPVVSSAFAAASFGLGAWSIHKLRRDPSDERIPLMGVMGAFVFTAQMINFSIPGTGSSGHLGGGLLLAAVLGPYGAFLTITTILMVQALFFGDGGLLALGCNIFNLGFIPCFIAWPLIFKPVMGSGSSRGRTFAGAMTGAVICLQAGAFSVVMQTLLSGRTELPFGTFLLLMQPIHLAIGVVEGLVTSAIVLFLLQHRPQTLQGIAASTSVPPSLRRRTATVMILLTIITGTLLSSFASADPDGLEWSVARAAGTEELKTTGEIHRIAASIQRVATILPDYDFKSSVATAAAKPINSGTALSGLIGGAVTLLFLSGAGALLVRSRKRLPIEENREHL